jgi:hypothetical protein
MLGENMITWYFLFLHCYLDVSEMVSWNPDILEKENTLAEPTYELCCPMSS